MAARSLLVAALGEGAVSLDAARTWIGFGVTGANDAELPVDCLSMLLLAKALGDNSPVIYLADRHAVEGGHCIADVEARVIGRLEQLSHLAAIIQMKPRFALASHLASNRANAHWQRVAAQALHGAPMEDRRYLTPYSVRAIGDTLYFHNVHGRNIKIGWVPRPQLEPGKGGFSEYNATDRFVLPVHRDFVAAYSGPGVTLDSKCPIAVPYTVKGNPGQRLMLTGPDRGDIRRKLDAASPHQARDVRAQVDRLVVAYEFLVGPLLGDDSVDKLENLVDRISA
ncbi:MAG: hypothetical protein ABI625_03045 [bacterium]